MHPAVANALAWPVFRPLFRPVTRGGAVILMFHRFTDDPASRNRHTLHRLEANLTWLRRRGFRFAALQPTVEALLAGEPLPPRTVVMTVDDGYADFADLAAPVFARHDCPVTIFLTTGFLDGLCWQWWDQVALAVRQSPIKHPRVPVNGEDVDCAWRTEREYQDVVERLTTRLKRIPDHVRRQTIAAFPETLEVDLPAVAPDGYGPMRWDQLAGLARMGVTFGPHTITHPILARTEDAQSREEIHGSWARVRDATDAAIPVFAYPNGERRDFGEREERLVLEAGMVAALSTIPGFASRAFLARTGPCAMPRIGYSEHPGYFPQTVVGMEPMKQAIRSLIWRD
jgi:peptidoglycan/xylan/chitin deacetylase (PgdA/CDA1 family)